MSNALIANSTLEDIADAIRAKLGTQATMLPSEMAGNIRQISGGGGGIYQQKTVHPAAVSQTVNPDSGYDALSAVTVEGMELQSKSATPSGVAQTIEPDSGKDGLSQVSIAAATLQTKSATAGSTAQTITADAGYYGLSSVEVAAITPTEALTLVWSDPTLTSMGAQALSLDLSDYQYVVIKAIDVPTAIYNTFVFKVNATATANWDYIEFANLTYSSVKASARRGVDVRVDGIQFANGLYYYSTSSSKSSMSVAVPRYIWGLKTSLTDLT